MKEAPVEIKEHTKNIRLDNYEIVAKIGQGGYGTIYKAIQSNTGQEVAIKMLKLDDDIKVQKRAQYIARFERETELCAKINHPNIVKLIDKGYSDATHTPYAVFELVSGCTLKRYIMDNQGLSITETAEIMTQILDALYCAHASGIIHRDLKPHNIMVTHMASRPHVKVLDFGVGAFTQKFKSSDYKTITLTQEVLGTPNYSAPEQLRGEPATEKSDIYAWGLMFIECLTAKTVMKGKSIAQVFQQQLMPSEIVLPSFILGHPLGNLLRKVLKKNSNQRVSNVQSVLEEFTSINLNNLHVPKPEIVEDKEEDGQTIHNNFTYGSSQVARKQITVLCAKLTSTLQEDAILDLETIDAIEKDQLHMLKDVAMRYGGHIAGELASHLMVHFGFPDTDDTDARRAGRTALELMIEVKRRNAQLNEAHGVDIALRITLHSGTVLVFPNESPEGNVPKIALELLYKTAPGSILVGPITKKLLEPFLEFSSAEEYCLTQHKKPLRTYKLLGERSSEAMNLLRSSSIQRIMIGRTDEKNILIDAWKQSAKKGTSVLISGQAGIGKSRLSYEVKKHVRKGGFPTMEGRCLPEQQNSALYPFFSILRNHWGLNELGADALKVEKLEKNLAVLFPEDQVPLALLSSWLSLPTELSALISQKTPKEQKDLLFEVLKKCIGSLHASKSFLLVIEDAHWADPTTHEFLEYFVKAIDQQQCLLLLTARPIAQQAWQTEKTTHIKLQPLSKTATEQIIATIIENQNIAAEAVNYIAQRTDGVPLFIEELTTMLLEENYLIRQNDIYQLIEGIEKQEIPVTLQDLLNAKLDALGFAKETAQVAAAIGREFEYSLLVQSSLREESFVQQDIKELIDRNLIIRQRHVNGDTYLFRHALIRDTAYEGMAKEYRKKTHLRIAQSLKFEFQQRIKDNPFELARHFAKAGEYAQAIEHGTLSANKSIERSASKEAILDAKLVLKWAEHLESKAQLKAKVALYGVLSAAYMQANGWASEEVRYYSEAAIELLRESEHFEELFLHFWWKVLNGVVGGENEGLSELYNELEGYFDPANPLQKAVIKCAQAFIVYALANEDSFSTAARLCSESVANFEQAEDYGAEGHESIYGFHVSIFAKCLLSMSLNAMGETVQAEKEVLAMLEETKITNHSPSLGIALMYCAELYKLYDDKEKVRMYSEELVSLAKDHELPIYEAYGRSQLDWSNNSLASEKESFDTLYSEGSMFSLAHYQSQYAETYASKGNYEKALEEIDKCIGIDKGIPHQYYLARMYYLKASFMKALPKHSREEVMHVAHQGLELAKSQGAHYYVKEIENFLQSLEAYKNHIK